MTPTTPLQRLLETGAGTRLDADTVEPFLAQPGLALILFTGNADQRPEAQDVVVVGQELARLAGVPVRLGVVDVESDQALNTRFGVSVFPTLVFVRDGQKLSLVARMQDWEVYAQASSLWAPRKKPASTPAPEVRS